MHNPRSDTSRIRRGWLYTARKLAGSILLLTSIGLLTLITPTPALAVDLGDLNVPASRIPDWHTPTGAVNGYNDAKTWPQYDVTCIGRNTDCYSGMQPYTAVREIRKCQQVKEGQFGGMNCMIANAPDETVLFLPPGKYEVFANSMMRISRSNVVIRGAGPDLTIISRESAKRESVGGHCDANTGAIIASVCNPSWKGSRVNWVGGYGRGETNIQLASGGLFAAGDWILLRMSGDTGCELMDKHLNGGSSADGFVHITQVVDATGSDLEIDRPLRFGYDRPGCTGHSAAVFEPIERVGFESLRMTSSPSIPVGPNSHSDIKFVHLQFTAAVDSWLIDSKIDRGYDRWFSSGYSSGIWVQGNEFDDLDETIFFDTEGIYLADGAADSIVENNICTGTRVCQKIDNGAEGSVYAYNYTRQDQHKCERSFFNHGHFVRETLIEGNDIDCEITVADSFWGRNGPRHTAYRNRNVSNVCTSGHWSIVVNEDGNEGWPAAEYINVIGNTAGEYLMTPVQTNPACPPSLNQSPMSFLATDMWMEKNAWRAPAGSFDIGDFNQRSCGTGPDDACPGTNKNVSSPDTSWNGTYPTSLYRETRWEPNWWCEEACEWNQDGIGAFGDDFSTTLCQLPAGIRQAGGTCTEPDTDGDGIPNRLDGCVLEANAGMECDGDKDGIANWCDADLNNDGAVGLNDISALLDSIGTLDEAGDLNCDGAIGLSDVSRALDLQGRNGSVPGPSGLWCAGPLSPTGDCVIHACDGLVYLDEPDGNSRPFQPGGAECGSGGDRGNSPHP
jgi:hypothetical protein